MIGFRNVSTKRSVATLTDKYHVHLNRRALDCQGASTTADLVELLVPLHGLPCSGSAMHLCVPSSSLLLELRPIPLQLAVSSVLVGCYNRQGRKVYVLRSKCNTRCAGRLHICAVDVLVMACCIRLLYITQFVHHTSTQIPWGQAPHRQPSR